MKKNSGITLIALIITIIVLLILAGVSLAMISGENGILGRASDARVNNAIGEAKDAIALAVADATSEWYEKVYVEGIVTDEEADGYDENLKSTPESLNYWIATKIEALCDSKSLTNEFISTEVIGEAGESNLEKYSSVIIAITCLTDNEKTCFTQLSRGSLNAWQHENGIHEK